MLFQVLCGFEPIFYTTHPNEEPIKCEKIMEWVNKADKVYFSSGYIVFFLYITFYVVNTQDQAH